MTRYVGLDVRKRFVVYCILDVQGKKLARGQLSCVRMTLEAFATTILQPSDHLALEASTNTWSVVAILKSHVARLVVSYLWARAGIQWLRELPLPLDERLSLDGDLRLLAACDEELAAIDKLIAITAHQGERLQLLMTLPGVNFVGAVGLLAALGDISRFKDGDHAAAYLGLTPSIHQSGKHCYRGRITKAGNSHARWLLTQGIQQLLRHPGPLGVFFRRLAKRRNRNVAIVATARKLVTIAFLMLKHGKPERYAKPELLRKKFRKLHYVATGERLPVRRTGRPHGLGEICREIGLPALMGPSHLPPGEQAMLKKRKLAGWVQQIHSDSVLAGKKRSSRKTKSSV